MHDIWAVLEYSESTFHGYSDELLAELVEVAQRQQHATTVCAVVLTTPGASLPALPLLLTLGVQHLYLLEHPQLTQYTTEGYTSSLAWLISQHAPLLVAASATPNGRDWMPRLAARLHLPFVPGCLALDLHEDALFALRSVYEGRAYIETRTELRGYTALATLIPGVRGKPLEVQDSLSSHQNLVTTRFTPQIEQGHGFESPLATRSSVEHLLDFRKERIRRISVQAPSPEEVELDAAERIVAGGRGVGRDGFTHIAAFARLLGAAVGATRVATDRGWIEHARQIGSTGKHVHAKLYIACGISGAAQHTSGMRESQTVVAINPDRTAPIFALADLGLLGDANQVLPLAAVMIEELS